ncbi:MAG: hypothetical protein V8Q69_08120 [Bacteroides caccae]
MNEIQIAMKDKANGCRTVRRCLRNTKSLFHISWVDRLWNNLKQLLSGVKHWTGLK